MGDFQFGKVKMPVEPDATGFRRQLATETKAAAEGIEVKVKAEPDISGFTASLRRMLKAQIKESGVDVSIPVNLKIDRQQLKTDIRFIQAQVSAQNVKLELGVTIPKSAVTAELRRVRDVIKAERNVEIVLTPVVLKKDIQAAIRDLKAFARAEGAELPLRPTLNANKGAFIAEVRAFISEIQRSIPDLHIGVKADTGAAIATRAAISRSLGDGKDINHIDDKLKQLAKTAGAITGPLGGVGSQFARLTQSGSLLAAGIGGLGVAFAGIIGYGAKIAADAQLADQGIRRLTESVGFSNDQSSRFIKQLEQFAAVTPFEVPQVKEATKLLLGAGTAADEILPTLTRITDAGAAVGATTENIENVAKALAKVRGKGTAQLLELNQIRRNLPGFDPVRAIADFKGQSLAETYSQISKKAIPAGLAIEAINRGLEAQPGALGAAAAAAETLSGRFATLKDNVALGFKNAFLQPEVEKPLNDLLKRLATNAQAQVADGARSLAPIITAFGPALESGVKLFLELTKASAPFFTKLLEGATILTDRLTPAVSNLRPLFSTFGDLVIALVPVLSTILNLVLSGVSTFSLFGGALRLVTPLLNTVADVLDGLPEPLRQVIGLILILNRQKIFASLAAAGPQVLEYLKGIGSVMGNLAKNQTVDLINKLDAFSKSAKTAGAAGATAFKATADAATAAAAQTAAASAAVGTAIERINVANFQQARVRAPGIGSGALGLPSAGRGALDIIDVSGVEKVAALGPGVTKTIEAVGAASAGAAAKTGLLGSALRGAAGLAASAGNGFLKFISSISTPQLAAIAIGIGLIVNQFRQANKEAGIAAEGGKKFAESVIGGLNDTSKKTVSLSDSYLKDLRDQNSDLGKIFNNAEFKAALDKRNETVSDYAFKLSKDSKTAFEAFTVLANAAGDERGTFSQIGSAFGSDDTGSGIERILARQKATVGLLKESTGAGADTVKSVIAEQEKLLVSQGKVQRTFGTKNGIVFYNDVLDENGKKVADYNLLTEATVNKLKTLGISYDFATGKTEVFDQGTTNLANTLDLSLDEVSEFQKAIDTLSGSLETTFDKIRGTDVLTGANGVVAQLGGASVAIMQLMQDGQITAEELAALATDMGLTGDAASELIQKGVQFGNLYVAQIQKTQDAFKGLVPSVSQVFEDLKGAADGVVPKFDEVLKELGDRLVASARVNDNIGEIIRRGGSGLIEVLSQLPAEAQAAYAAAIAQADDKTFVGLEAKARDLNAEGIRQIQNQGLLSIATVQSTVDATLAPIAVAQKALEDKAAEVRAKLTSEANKPGLSPQQRRLLREDRDNTTASTVASTSPELIAQVTQVTGAVNAQLATVPMAAKQANDDAVAGLLPLPQQITSATVPGLQTWSYDVAATTDTAANAFGSLAIRGVDAMQRLANGIETPAARIVEVVGSMAAAINAVSGQIGSGDTIVVPGITKKYIGARTGKVEVKHSGGVVGDGISSSRLNGPVASNEQLVLAQKGEGVVPVDAMKRLGLQQFRFIQKGDITGLLAAKDKVPGAKANVSGANDIGQVVAGGLGPVLGSAIGGAIDRLAKNVTKYLDEVSSLIDARVGATPGLIPGGNIGGAGSGAAAGWIRAAMAITGAPESWFTGLMTLAKRESGFNPRATNLWDSNAKKGTPSIGLMQTIGPTFRAYALPGYGDIYNPVHNAIASIRYIRARYGDISRVQQANPNKPPKGYYFGDLVTTEQTARIAEGGRAELILPIQSNPKRAEDLLAKYIFDPTVSGVNADSLIARLEKAVSNRKSDKQVTVADGGSLVTLQMQGESIESLMAQLGTRAGAIVSQILS